MAKKKTAFFMLMIVLLWLTLLNNAWARQVITDEDKAWARQALEQEKALGAPVTPNSVAVMNFNNATKQSKLDPLQKGMAFMLITDLSKVEGLQVLERVRMQALLDELKLGESGLVEPGSAPRVGQLFGAYWLLGGELAEEQGSRLQIKSNVLQVPKQQIAGQPATRGALEELIRLEKELLFEIIALLKVEITPEQERELRKPLTTDMDALMSFFKGLSLSDQKKYKEAAQQYSNALKQDPQMASARDALAELKSLFPNLMVNRSVELLQSLRNETTITGQIPPTPPTERLILPSEIPSSQLPEPEPTPQGGGPNFGGQPGARGGGASRR